MKGIHKYKLSLIPLGLLVVTLLSGYFLSNITLNANAVNTKNSNISLHVGDTCSLSGNIEKDDSEFINGQEREAFHILSLSTFCNDNDGYSLYAVGYSGTQNDLTNTAEIIGRTDLIGATTGNLISTGVWADRNTGDNASKSIYSLKLEPSGTTNTATILNGFNDYIAVPSTETKVASYGSNTAEGTNSVVKASYAAKIANVQASDTYTGQVKYTMVHPSSNTTTGITFDDAFQLAGKTKVSGTAYYAMQDMNAAICNKVTTPLTADAASTPQAQLIDIRDNKVYWVAKLMDGKCWMTQNLDLNLSTTTPLTSENTNINPNTPANTATGYSVSNGVVSWTPARNTIDSTNYGTITPYSGGAQNEGFATSCSETVTTNCWTNDGYSSYSDDPGEIYMLPTESTTGNIPANWYAIQDSFYYDLTSCEEEATNRGAICNEHNKIGNYYNFAAATATNSVSDSVANVADKTTMPNSICPKGWRLPKGITGDVASGVASSNNSEFDTLFYAYSVTAKTGATASENVGYNTAADGVITGLNLIRNNPLYFLRSGYINGGTLNNAGTAGFAWSGTISSSTNGYRLRYHSTGIDPAGSGNQRNGFPVRCVIDDSMQNFDQDAADTLAINETLTLRDTRDNEQYTVGKLRDGKVWMTSNLNLTGGTEIESTKSDVASDWTLPVENGFQEGNRLPESTNTFSSMYNAYVYNTGNDSCETSQPCFSVYSYTAATAGSNIGIIEKDENAPYSICPKGWKLPTTNSEPTTESDFYNLAVAYGMSEGVVSEAGTSFYEKMGPGTTPNFIITGRYDVNGVTYGGRGFYQSATNSSTNENYALSLSLSDITTTSNPYYYRGSAVRCMLR